MYCTYVPTHTHTPTPTPCKVKHQPLQYAVVEHGQLRNELVDGVELLCRVTQFCAQHELAVHLKGEDGLWQLVEEGFDE